MNKIALLMPDLLLVAGAGSVTTGAALLNTAAGFIVAGVLMLYAGVKTAKAE